MTWRQVGSPGLREGRLGPRPLRTKSFEFHQAEAIYYSQSKANKLADTPGIELASAGPVLPSQCGRGGGANDSVAIWSLMQLELRGKKRGHSS